MLFYIYDKSAKNPLSFCKFFLSSGKRCPAAAALSRFTRPGRLEYLPRRLFRQRRLPGRTAAFPGLYGALPRGRL
ncbi:MAG: hypothetical protein DBY17_06130 [Oscillospiraceae bacterium]|nr:MAG: hypothetical protein DBY17_06130 [Oscillospiraceae bacterium]